MADGELTAVLRDLIAEWRDEAWQQQRGGRPEIRDCLHSCATELAELLEEHTE